MRILSSSEIARISAKTGAFWLFEGREAVDDFEVGVEVELTLDFLEFVVEFEVRIKYFQRVGQAVLGADDDVIRAAVALGQCLVVLKQNNLEAVKFPKLRLQL